MQVKKQYATSHTPEALAATIKAMVILQDYVWPEEEEKPAALSAGLAAEPKAAAAAAVPAAPPVVRMANLCVIAGFAVNGVAAIHSEIVKDDVFNDFYKLWPKKFQNKTNGVTPRRWMQNCNPALSSVITSWLGTDAWVKDADLLKGLVKHADDPKLQAEWAAAKRANKVEQVAYLKKQTGITVSPDVMWDIQVKRIHEYKRQLLNILGIAYRYKKMKAMTPAERKQARRLAAAAAWRPASEQSADASPGSPGGAARLHGGRQGVRDVPAGEAHREAGQRGGLGGQQRP